MKKVGLVLGSGGARGCAHIGVIRALQDADIPISYITGASIGALIGSIYVAGELDDLEEFIRALDWKGIVSFFDVVFPSSGLLDGNRVYELLSDHLHSLTMEETEIPFCCVATDLLSGEEVCLKTGPMVDAVRASISIPGIFTPFQKDNVFLGDGGIVNPLPVDIMQTMGADVVVAVNLNSQSAQESLSISIQDSLTQQSTSQQSTDPATPSLSLPHSLQSSRAPSAEPSQDPSEADSDPNADNRSTEMNGEDQTCSQASGPGTESKQGRIAALLERVQRRYEEMQEHLQAKLDSWMPEERQGMNIFDVIGSSLNVMEQQVTRSKLEAHPPDVLIEPALRQFGIFDFHQSASIIEAGYRAMSSRIPELKEKLMD